MWPFDGGSDSERDPKDPSTWTPEERTDFLGSLGYRWVSGNDASAVWQAPNGSRVSEGVALDSALGTFEKGSPVEAAPATKAAAAPDRITQNGVVYERSADGTWVPAVGLPQSTSASGGMTAGQSAQLALDREKMQVQTQQWQQSFDQATATAAQVHADKMAELQQAAMINMYNIGFNDKKQAFAESSDNKHLAQQAQQMAQDLQYKQADIQLRMQTLNAQYATFNATAQNEAARFNAQMAFNVQQANQQFESQRQDRLANIATQAGTLAQDTGDRGKLAATLTANSGWGGANAATANTDYRTDESKTPLESLLRTREEVKNQAAPFSYSPIQAQQIGAGGGMPSLASLAGWQPGYGGRIPGDTNVMGQGVVSGNTAGAPGAQIPAGYQSASQGDFDRMAAAAAASGGTQAVANPLYQAAAGGGFLSSAMRKVGERGPELQIDLADGRTMVLNQKQQSALAKAGLDLTSGAQGYASGGLFDNAFSNVPDSNRDLSTGFLNDAYKRAVSGTPWENANQLPSPVWLSSPGTNPLTTQLVSSLKALGEGVPQETTQYLAGLYKPLGARETVIGRSR